VDFGDDEVLRAIAMSLSEPAEKVVNKAEPEELDKMVQELIL